MDEQPKPAVGSIWGYKDANYRIRRSEGLRVKDPSDANWHDAVEYEREDGSVELTFVRRLDDFNAKFVEVVADQ